MISERDFALQQRDARSAHTARGDLRPMTFKCEIDGCGHTQEVDPVDYRDAAMEGLMPSAEAPLVGYLPDGWTITRTQLPMRAMRINSGGMTKVIKGRISEIKLICPRHTIAIGVAT